MQGNENLSEATAEATEEFYSWIADMPLDEAMTALRGLKDYEREIQKELFEVDGYIKYED
jgi:hypothetical protein